MSERYKELFAFIPSWKVKPKAQVVEEIASYSLETKRIPDPYSFLIEDSGKLKSPQTGELIEKSIEKSSYLGKKEWGAIERIEEWTRGRTEGLVVWISPPHSERSLFTKVVVSEVVLEDGERKLFNRSVMLSLTKFGCVDLASRIQQSEFINTTAASRIPLAFLPGDEAPLRRSRSSTASYRRIPQDSALGEDVISPENLRETPLFFNKGSGDEAINFLEANVGDQACWLMIREGYDLISKQEVREKAEYLYDKIILGSAKRDGVIKAIVEKEVRAGTFGTSEVSCPPKLPSAFETFYANSFASESKFVRECGMCGRKIGREIRKGFRCVCGGRYEGC